MKIEVRFRDYVSNEDPAVTAYEVRLKGRRTWEYLTLFVSRTLREHFGSLTDKWVRVSTTKEKGAFKLPTDARRSLCARGVKDFFGRIPTGGLYFTVIK
jgi:ABC-type anion transport system duplicated permease subunit